MLGVKNLRFRGSTEKNILSYEYKIRYKSEYLLRMRKKPQENTETLKILAPFPFRQVFINACL